MFGFDDDDEVEDVTTFCSKLDVKGNKSCREGGEVESSALSSEHLRKNDSITNMIVHHQAEINDQTSFAIAVQAECRSKTN